MTPRRIWTAIISVFVVGNLTVWRKGTDATLCASTLRPVIDALGPIGEPAMWGSLLILGRHLVKPLKRRPEHGRMG